MATHERLTIQGSATPSNPAGIVVSRAGALSYARRNMPRDLRKAGFIASVARGYYGDYWVINYGKTT